MILAGNVSAREMLKTFNLGLGMVLITDKVHVDQVLGMLRGAGETAWIIGDVIPRNPASCESILLILNTLHLLVIRVWKN